MKSAKEQDGVSGLEPQLRRYDGAIRVCSLYGRFIGARGNRLLMFVYMDINEKKEADESLRVSESYNKVLFHGSRIPLAVLDPESGCFIDANQAAVQIYGFEQREDLLGKEPKDLSPPTQDGGRPSQSMAQDMIRRGVAEGALVFEWQHNRPGGTVWDAEIHMMSFSHHHRLLLQLSLEDITHRKEAEHEREKLQAQLVQS